MTGRVFFILLLEPQPLLPPPLHSKRVFSEVINVGHRSQTEKILLNV